MSNNCPCIYARLSDSDQTVQPSKRTSRENTKTEEKICEDKTGVDDGTEKTMCVDRNRNNKELEDKEAESYTSEDKKTELKISEDKTAAISKKTEGMFHGVLEERSTGC